MQRRMKRTSFAWTVAPVFALTVCLLTALTGFCRFLLILYQFSLCSEKIKGNSQELGGLGTLLSLCCSSGFQNEKPISIMLNSFFPTFLSDQTKEKLILDYLCTLSPSLKSSIFDYQIRRYVYHDVIRLDDAEKLMDCASVQVSGIFQTKIKTNYLTFSVFFSHVGIFLFIFLAIGIHHKQCKSGIFKSKAADKAIQRLREHLQHV